MQMDNLAHSTIEVLTYPLFQSWFHNQYLHHNL